MIIYIYIYMAVSFLLCGTIQTPKPPGPWGPYGAPYGVHMGPHMSPHMGPHGGPIWGPYGSPYEAHMGPHMGPHIRSHMGPHWGPIWGSIRDSIRGAVREPIKGPKRTYKWGPIMARSQVEPHLWRRMRDHLGPPIWGPIGPRAFFFADTGSTIIWT